MQQKFTKNDLIRFIYKETSVQETLAIQEALNNDQKLLTKYQELLQAYQQLPKVKFDASPSSIQNILRYSQHTALETYR